MTGEKKGTTNWRSLRSKLYVQTTAELADTNLTWNLVTLLNYFPSHSSWCEFHLCLCLFFNKPCKFKIQYFSKCKCPGLRIEFKSTWIIFRNDFAIFKPLQAKPYVSRILFLLDYAIHSKYVLHVQFFFLLLGIYTWKLNNERGFKVIRVEFSQ